MCRRFSGEIGSGWLYCARTVPSKLKGPVFRDRQEAGGSFVDGARGEFHLLVEGFRDLHGNCRASPPWLQHPVNEREQSPVGDLPRGLRADGTAFRRPSGTPRGLDAYMTHLVVLCACRAHQGFATLAANAPLTRPARSQVLATTGATRRSDQRWILVSYDCCLYWRDEDFVRGTG